MNAYMYPIKMFCSILKLARSSYYEALVLILSKKEEIYQTLYYDFKMARKSIFEYIESWFNCKQIHSAIDYMTPQEKDKKFTKTA